MVLLSNLNASQSKSTWMNFWSSFCSDLCQWSINSSGESRIRDGNIDSIEGYMHKSYIFDAALGGTPPQLAVGVAGGLVVEVLVVIIVIIVIGSR